MKTEEELAYSLDHPCKQSCSGWAQGRERGLADAESRIKELEEKLKIAVEALEFYGSGSHFQYCGDDEFEPESVSGEPENWLCGGTDAGCFQYESGFIGRITLEKIKGEG